LIAEAVCDGVHLLSCEQETFAYTDAWDEAAKRYRGLRGGGQGSVALDNASVVVKPEAAMPQFQADAEQATKTGGCASIAIRGDVSGSGRPQRPGARALRRRRGQDRRACAIDHAVPRVREPRSYPAGP